MISTDCAGTTLLWEGCSLSDAAKSTKSMNDASSSKRSEVVVSVEPVHVHGELKTPEECNSPVTFPHSHRLGGACV
jgi:hypothetical protein